MRTSLTRSMRRHSRRPPGGPTEPAEGWGLTSDPIICIRRLDMAETQTQGSSRDMGAPQGPGTGHTGAAPIPMTRNDPEPGLKPSGIPSRAVEEKGPQSKGPGPDSRCYSAGLLLHESHQVPLEGPLGLGAPWTLQTTTDRCLFWYSLTSRDSEKFLRPVPPSPVTRMG
uniref:Uncharacterized protein n=1 Tax=Knipowitschia caucasica TaxID=637954 RepID=A0AAV2JGD0_KNICA